MSSTGSPPKGISSIKEIKAYFSSEISKRHTELHTCAIAILQSRGYAKANAEDLEEKNLQRLVEYYRKLEIDRLKRRPFGPAEKALLGQLDRRNERMRILHLELEDLPEMQTREIQRFENRKHLTRDNLCSGRDIEEYYGDRIMKLQNEKALIEQVDESEWGLRTMGCWFDIFSEEKNLRAEMDREPALGRVKGWYIDE